MKRDPSALEDVRDVAQALTVVAEREGSSSVVTDIKGVLLRLKDAARKLQSAAERQHLSDLAAERGNSPLSRALLESADRIEEEARILNRRASSCGACGNHVKADRDQFQSAVMVDAIVAKLRGLAASPTVAAAERETADATS